MASLTQSLRIAIGNAAQSDLFTPTTSVVSLRMTSKEIPQFVPINESDKDDIGKGVYATRLFKSHCDVKFPMSGFLSSEWAKLLIAFGMGKVDGSTPDVGGVDGLNLPATTVVAANGQGTPNQTIDHAMIGCIVDKFGFKFTSGTGRQNATFTSNWVGCGLIARPSGITVPAPIDEHLLNAGGMSTCTINGVEYLASKRFVSYEFDWDNRLREASAYFPGSGTQNGFQIKGRMRRGSPNVTTKIRVEVESGSPEEDNLLNQVEGTANITVAGEAGHSLTIAHDRVVPMTTKFDENDGIVIYDIDLEPLEDLDTGSVVVCTANSTLSVTL